jgi:hypothetical protein
MKPFLVAVTNRIGPYPGPLPRAGEGGRKVVAGLLLAASLAVAGEPAPSATSPTQPLGGTSAPPAVAGSPRQITWRELMPKDWNLTKEFEGLDLNKLQDGDPRASEILVRMQAAADKAPTNPAFDGVAVKIPGFVVPLEESDGQVREFLLVPYFGACIHTPPPPANQIIDVKAPKGTSLHSMDMVWVTGTLRIVRADTMMGVSGYHIDADGVSRYAASAAR